VKKTYFSRIDGHLLTLMHNYSAVDIRENRATHFEDRADELSRLIPLTIRATEVKYPELERDD
jgi:hypothetical protein